MSSDVWRLDAGEQSYCVKRALERLKTAAEWRVPVHRSQSEWRWLRFAHALDPSFAPRPVAIDEARGVFAMAFLEPAAYPLWKAQLLRGEVVPAFAEALGAKLVRVNAASARAPELARQFATDDLFFALRIDPFLNAAARAHPDRAAYIEKVSRETFAMRVALVHGDVTPKNILSGPDGPVLLDAECAWWGDPAFDVALLLTHLLLKCAVVPDARDRLLACCDAFVGAYASGVDWEAATDTLRRACALIPALLLARVDGKSPVEYLRGEAQKHAVRRAAFRLLDTNEGLEGVITHWKSELMFGAGA